MTDSIDNRTGKEGCLNKTDSGQSEEGMGEVITSACGRDAELVLLVDTEPIGCFATWERLG